MITLITFMHLQALYHKVIDKECTYSQDNSLVDMNESHVDHSAYLTTSEVAVEKDLKCQDTASTSVFQFASQPSPVAGVAVGSSIGQGQTDANSSSSPRDPSIHNSAVMEPWRALDEMWTVLSKRRQDMQQASHDARVRHIIRVLPQFNMLCFCNTHLAYKFTNISSALVCM